MNKILKTGIVVLTGIISLTGCASASSSSSSIIDKVHSSKTLVIGTEGTFAPFSYHNSSDQLVGYDVDVIRAVAKELGYKVTFKEAKWDSLIAGLDSNKYEAVVNQVSITSERQAKYDFSIPYTYSYPSVITKKENTSIQSFNDIKGKKFSQTGTSNYSKIVQKYKGTIVATNDWNENVSLVLSGRVDGTVNDSLAFYDYMNKKPDADLKIASTSSEVSKQAVIFNKHNSAFKKEIDKALTALRKKGTLKTISEKYFKKDVSVEQ